MAEINCSSRVVTFNLCFLTQIAHATSEQLPKLTIEKFFQLYKPFRIYSNQVITIHVLKALYIMHYNYVVLTAIFEGVYYSS